jgi:release factor glutamine methyltransferase
MGVILQTLKNIRPYLAEELKEIYTDNEISSLASIIIYTVLGIQKLHFLKDSGLPLSKENVEKVISVCSELKKGKPVQYITGETLFYNCRIKVTPDTLIPRPETEELVDMIIKENSDYRGGILDIGTGSGCIAIALAANIPYAEVTAIDISPAAVRVAGENARLNNVNVRFLVMDFFDTLLAGPEKAGIIVSNPPYVKESEKNLMRKNVLDYEPHGALFVPDDNPVEGYKAILRLAETNLAVNGTLYFEINEMMGDELARILQASGYHKIDLIKDINGRNRFIKAVRNDRNRTV